MMLTNILEAWFCRGYSNDVVQNYAPGSWGLNHGRSWEWKMKYFI